MSVVVVVIVIHECLQMSGALCINGSLISGQGCVRVALVYFAAARTVCASVSSMSAVFSVSVVSDGLKTRPMQLPTVTSCAMALMANSFL